MEKATGALNARHLKHLLVDCLEGIYALLELDIIGWELRLYVDT
jgi:hypothetical protein